tara:strand:+ start:43 stop:696 length:654 start_codon:yes stop_codon:yes gene_type:complete
MKLLTSNSKIDKSVKLNPEYEATILQMLPGKGVCVNYKGCIKTCLAFTGFAKIFPSVNKSRQAKKDLYINDRQAFLKQLNHEIGLQVKRANKKGKQAVVRLNGFTDIDWDKECNIIERWSNFGPNNDSVQFYDYTADANKVLNNTHKNYHLTFSHKTGKDSDNTVECMSLFQEGINIAVVENPENREKFGTKSIDGDKSDFRFLDKKGQIVWLSFKA